MELRDLFKLMTEKKASDLHVRANALPFIRINGELLPATELPVLQNEEIEDMAYRMMNPEQQKHFTTNYECDLSVAFKDLGRFRLNIYKQKGTINIVARCISSVIPTLQQLNLPTSLKKLSENINGLVLVTGPTGSGKSTTLAAMINHINATRNVNIITVEDPIEFIYADNKSIISQRELGIDTLTFPGALRHIVRQDPDVILIGEIRDTETMSAALTAAQMGHLVLTTLHTIDTIQTVSRVVDLFPPHQQAQARFQFGDTLRGIVSQRLLPHSSGKGMVPAVEILICTPLVKKHLIENNTAEITNLIKNGQYYGMQTFNQAMIKLFKENNIKLEDALENSPSPEELMMAIRGIETSEENSANQMMEIMK